VVVNYSQTADQAKEVVATIESRGGLDYLRKVRFPGLSVADPIGAFLREIADVIGRPSRN
jgi:hypothetical protein